MTTIDPELAPLLVAESAAVEWKEGVNPKQVVVSLCAMANDFQSVGGGRVVCGVDQAGGVVGLTAPEAERLENQVIRWCNDLVAPAFSPRVARYPVGSGRQVLVFRVLASPTVHVHHEKGRGDIYWIREGSHDVQARGAKLTTLFGRKEHAPPYLDQPALGATLADIDWTAVDETLGPLSLPRAPADYFEPGARLMPYSRPLVVAEPDSDPVPTRLALLLFGRRPTEHLHGARVVIGTYSGTTRTSTTPLRSEFTNRPLPRLIQETVEVLVAQAGEVLDKSGANGIKRTSRPVYSERAIREAVVNAFAHRDYASDQPVFVERFADRINISNPGGPLQPMASLPEAASDFPAPIWRNQSLGTFLLQLKLAENVGQGLPTIVEETRRTANHPPTIKTTPDRFQVTLPAFRPTAVPRASANDAVVLVAVGAPSLLNSFERQRGALGLQSAAIAADVSWPTAVRASQWNEVAGWLRDELALVGDDAERIHLFFRGPLVFGPLLGAVLARRAPLVCYHHEQGREDIAAFVIDRRFLLGTE